MSREEVPEISEKGAALGGGGPVRGVNATDGLVVVRLREVCGGYGCCCDRGSLGGHLAGWVLTL